MKLKLGIVFIILAVFVIIGSFYLKNYMMMHKTVEAVEVTSSNIRSILASSTEPFVDYQDQALSFGAEVFEPNTTTILHFWASWCEPCVNEIPELIQFVEQQAKAGKAFKVIVVSMDYNKDDLQKFLKSFPKLDQPPFIRIWDKKNFFAEKMNIDRLPGTIVWHKDKELQHFYSVVPWMQFRLDK